MEDRFEPRLVCFLCKWCASGGADLAGTSRMEYAPNGIPLRVMCSGRVDPQHLLWALQSGADGVLIGGCHPGDCHYEAGNYKALKRVLMLKSLLRQLGIEESRVRIEWISAAEGKKFVAVMNGFVEELRRLGPIRRFSFDLEEHKLQEAV